MAYTKGYGAARPKSGDNVKALSRSAGYKATMKACDSKTGSRHKGSKLHNKWQSKPDGSGNDNVKGYGD
jgi:hypothetical protein